MSFILIYRKIKPSFYCGTYVISETISCRTSSFFCLHILSSCHMRFNGANVRVIYFRNVATHYTAANNRTVANVNIRAHRSGTAKKVTLFQYKNCLISGKSLLLYRFTRRVMKLTAAISRIPLLSTSHNVSSNILLSSLSPYVDDIIENHQCGFRRNRSTADHIFCIRHVLEKNGSAMRQYISYS
jgi:hypothetical protein